MNNKDDSIYFFNNENHESNPEHFLDQSHGDYNLEDLAMAISVPAHLQRSFIKLIKAYQEGDSNTVKGCRNKRRAKKEIGIDREQMLEQEL